MVLLAVVIGLAACGGMTVAHTGSSSTENTALIASSTYASSTSSYATLTVGNLGCGPSSFMCDPQQCGNLLVAACVPIGQSCVGQTACPSTTSTSSTTVMYGNACLGGSVQLCDTLQCVGNPNELTYVCVPHGQPCPTTTPACPVDAGALGVTDASCRPLCPK